MLMDRSDVGEARGEQLIEVIRRAVIGEDEAVEGPFGVRRVIYADYTASGRSLSFIEQFLQEAVLPLYANTHTESSGTGRQTTRFREDARESIRRAVGASGEHAVVFCGSGTTGAIDRLIGVMNLRLPRELDLRYGLSDRIPAGERPVVFIGPYEHHANELPWRESICDVVTIHEDLHGGIDLGELEARLGEYADRPLRIGSFSAASNVTGITSPVRDVSMLLHRHGALALWDYAAAAPYVKIDMCSRVNAGDDDLDYLDAIFLSPHKMIGGPGTPGVLVARRELFQNTVPDVIGGGVVSYVNPAEHRYLDDPEVREEAGTPAIVESIRAGLVFKLKSAVGEEVIRAREESFIRRAIDRWARHPQIEILGDRGHERLSIVSFVIRRPGAKYLHHNYVVAMLNDLFGIQSRGGCSCAGPYGHRLLGIDLEQSRAFEREISRGCEGLKPGWVRVNFNYFISETVFEYVLDAVDLVATHGWALLDQYGFDETTGLWRHRRDTAGPPLSLDQVQFTPEGLTYPHHRHAEPESRLAYYLAEARRILEAAAASRRESAAATASTLSDDFEQLRWFPLPGEVVVRET
jgi:selenocysteine lyase/cysteine desulfurase